MELFEIVCVKSLRSVRSSQGSTEEASLAIPAIPIQSSRQSSRSGLTLHHRRVLLAVILLSPAILLRMFTTVYPFIQTAILSVQKYNPAFAADNKFVGTGNFVRMANDIVVQNSVSFTLMFVFISTFFQVVL